MKVLLFYIKYRLIIGVVCLIAAVLINIQTGFWPAFILYLIGAISIIGYFLLGPMRLIQSAMEEGNLEEAKRIVEGIKFPGLLIKPVRSVYYTIKGNLAMMDKDLETAEKHMKKSISLGGGQLTKQAEGPNKLQLGMIAMQKGNMKEAESYVRQAIRAGLPDKENNAAAYLQLCSIMMNKREFRAAKDYFRKAKSFKATTPEIVQQIKEIEKYIPRLPG
ncbi:MAG: hypothetical protein KF829_11250 [Ferruginibacter sp.]|nr:hypothetical protein [Ferruginibacter sp.]